MRGSALTIAAITLAGCMATSTRQGSVQLDTTCAHTIPAGVPVEMEVTLTNIGKDPIRYWCGGPGNYPGAEHFAATVTNSLGKTANALPTNGQYTQGSGVGRLIPPGESIQVPLAIATLPAGTWTFRVTCSSWTATKTNPVIITVIEDPQARKEWQQNLLAKIRRGDDPFAQHVAGAYPMEGVINELLTDLGGNDDTSAHAADRTLSLISKPPAGLDKAVHNAVTAQLARTPDKTNLNLLAGLMDSAGHQPTDEMLNAVLEVAHTPVPSPGDDLRCHAVAALRYFPQKKSQDALQQFATDPNDRVKEAAKNAINHPWPPPGSISIPQP